MTLHTLSAALRQHADELHALAHQAAALSPHLGTALIHKAASLGLAHLAALTLERDLRAARASTAALEAEAIDDADAQARALHALETRLAYGRTIAGILAPVLNGTARPDGPHAGGPA